MQKGVAPILIVILVALLGIGGYFAYTSLRGSGEAGNVAISPSNTPQPSPSTTESTGSAEIANWKTYTNAKYSYTLKYPPEWRILTKGLSDESTSPFPIINSPCELSTESVCSQVSVSMNEEFREPNSISNKTNTKLDNEDAIAFEVSQPNVNESGMLLYAISVDHNNNKYTLTYSETQKDGHFITNMNNWKNKKIFDQILSTFKFTQ